MLQHSKHLNCSVLDQSGTRHAIPLLHNPFIYHYTLSGRSQRRHLLPHLFEAAVRDGHPEPVLPEVGRGDDLDPVPRRLPALPRSRLRRREDVDEVRQLPQDVFHLRGLQEGSGLPISC